MTPGAFIRALDEILGVPARTVTVYDRFLRQAGLLTKHGRGRGSAHRTPLDAARIVIALLVTNSPARAVDAVLDFGQFQTDGWGEQNARSFPHFVSEPFEFEELCGVSEAGTFEEHLAALFAAVPTEQFQKQYADATYVEPIMGGQGPGLSVDVAPTVLWASIDLNGSKYYYDPPGHRSKLLQKYRGISTTREIGIVRIGQALAGISAADFSFKQQQLNRDAQEQLRRDAKAARSQGRSK